MHYYTFILSRLPCGVSINFSFNKKIVFTDEFNIMFFCLDFGLRLFIQKFEFLNFFQIFLGVAYHGHVWSAHDCLRFSQGQDYYNSC